MKWEIEIALSQAEKIDLVNRVSRVLTYENVQQAPSSDNDVTVTNNTQTFS